MDFANYMGIFLDEGREAMQQLNDMLLRLERAPGDAELLNAVFRTAHTFKGMASTMGFDELAGVAHAMENLLDGMRAGDLTPQSAQMDLLLQGVEAMEQLLEAIGSQRPAPEVALGPLMAALEAAAPRVRVVPAEPVAPAEPLEIVPDAPGAPRGGLYSVVVTLEPMCLLKSVRAMMIVSSLELLGEVLDITPSLEELEWADETREFELLLQTDAAASAIEAAFQDLGEVEAVRVTELTPSAEIPEALSAEAPPLALDAAQRAQLESALAVGFKAVRLEVTLMPGSLMKAVRAVMVLNALQPFGEVVRLDPPMDTLDAQPGDRFWVTALSVAAPRVLHEALMAIGEVTAIAIQPITSAQLAGARPAEAPLERRVPAAPVEPAPEAPTGFEAVPRRQQTVRVSTEHLDALLGLVNELVADQARLAELSRRHGLAEISELARHMGMLTSAVQGEVRGLRLVPVEMVFNRFPRMVRNLSRELGKEVELVMAGQETLLDRLVVDELGDPLVHLLRNALDHGLETPAERVAAGKPGGGRLRLAAFQEGQHVVIEVADDGRGMDARKLTDKAVARGLLTRAQADQLGREEALELVFAPGFSTAEAVTNLSGRGVGLDVVRNKITALGGAIELDTAIGRGTTFRVRLPLALALVQAMLTDVGGEVYAIPIGCVEEVFSLDERAEHEALPLVRLGERLEVPGADGDAGSVVVVRTPTQRVGLVVEQLIGKQEIAVKPLSRLLGALECLTGAAPLEDGRIALIVDPGHL